VQLGAFTLEAPVSKTMIGRRAYARHLKGELASFVKKQAPLIGTFGFMKCHRTGMACYTWACMAIRELETIKAMPILLVRSLAGGLRATPGSLQHNALPSPSDCVLRRSLMYNWKK
jgi:hypothetical protein